MALSVLLLLTTGQVGWMGLAYFCQAGWNFGRTMALSQVRRVVEAHETGLAFGFTETIVYVVIVAASFASGVLYQYNPALPFQLSLGLIALTLPLVWLFAPRHDTHTAEASPVGEASKAGEGL
jgi:predicted MFS family arabinose efflux permease